MTDELWQLKRDVRPDGAAKPARKLDGGCLMVIAPTAIPTRRKLVAQLPLAPRWHKAKLTDRAPIKACDIRVPANRVAARRAGAATCRALGTATWLRCDGDGRGLQHQQTAVPA